MYSQAVLAQEKLSSFKVKSISFDLSGLTIINTNNNIGFRTFLNSPISPWMPNNNISFSLDFKNNFRIGINYLSFVADYLFLKEIKAASTSSREAYEEWNNRKNDVTSRYFDRILIHFGKSFIKKDHSLYCGVNFSRLFNGYEFILYDRSAPYYSTTPYYVGHSNYKGNGIGFSLAYRYAFFNQMYIEISNHFTYSKFQAEYFTYGNIPRGQPTENYRLSPINNTTHISFGYRFGK